MKGELGVKIMKVFLGLRAKTYSYLKDDNDESKRAKCAKKYVIKTKPKFENYKYCLEATQLGNKTIYPNNNKIDAKTLIQNHKEFIKNNKIILKSQQRFKSERHNVFNEEIHKVTLSLNHDKRIESIDSIETFVNGTKKDLIHLIHTISHI